MTGTFHVVGLGPGDPELMTLKAARTIAASPVIAYFAKRGRTGHARTIAASHIGPAAEEIRFEYPFTTEVALDDPRYRAEIVAFYDACAALLANRLATGHDAVLLCEGDPFFYGSSMYLYDRLSPVFPSEVVPGVSAMSGCWTRAGTPIAHGDDVLTVLPGTLDEDGLANRLQRSDASVIMKIGRNLPKIRVALERAGLSERALYIERGTMANERIIRLAERDESPAPYFSLVLVPGRQRER
ncbi:MAG: precorrin-2 C(20)-methyltransferase [Acetobacteraceae bacterium]|nr:precorrin-2 C(20)-methyltransferase [Acetobacteraceae bacterium]